MVDCLSPSYPTFGQRWRPMCLMKSTKQEAENCCVLSTSDASELKSEISQFQPLVFRRSIRKERLLSECIFNVLICWAQYRRVSQCWCSPKIGESQKKIFHHLHIFAVFIAEEYDRYCAHADTRVTLEILTENGFKSSDLEEGGNSKTPNNAVPANSRNGNNRLPLMGRRSISGQKNRHWDARSGKCYIY